MISISLSQGIYALICGGAAMLPLAMVITRRSARGVRDMLIERMRDGVLVMNEANRILDFNPAVCELFGLTWQALGKDVEQVFAAWPQLADILCCEQQEVQREVEVPGDLLRTLEVRVTLLRGKEDGFKGRLAVLRDITERKRIEEQLRLQSVALVSAANAINITRDDGTIVWVNPAFTQLTGYSLEEAIGQNPRILKSGVHDQAFYENLWKTILSGKVWHGETVNRRKDGSLYVEEQTIAPVQDEHGKITHFIAIKQDVTERRELERMRDDLTGMMVHDLRNPLGRIRLAFDMISGMSGPLTGEEQQRMRQIVYQSVDQMLNLVNAILDISRLENGQMPLEYSLLDLRQVIRQTLESQGPLAEPKGISLVSDLPPDLPLVQADARLVQRVMQNLTGNAVKFTLEGGRVQVKAWSDERQKALLVSVSDSGPGIPPDERERIFQKFTTGRVAGSGSGLGLAFCKLAVEAHGGRIWVDSNQAEGASFIFSLPLRDEEG